MDITRRAPVEADRREAVRGLSILQRRLRRLARLEAATGSVEILRFRAIRAWNIISCSGPPCCPNTWLLEATDGQCVWLTSWRDLRAKGEQFPGSDVTIERWGESHRLVPAKTDGPPIPTRDGTDMGHLEPSTEVAVYERGKLPQEMAVAIASA
jgi:hypothetical protein